MGGVLERELALEQLGFNKAEDQISMEDTAQGFLQTETMGAGGRRSWYTKSCAS